MTSESATQEEGDDRADVLNPPVADCITAPATMQCSEKNLSSLAALLPNNAVKTLSICAAPTLSMPSIHASPEPEPGVSRSTLGWHLQTQHGWWQ